MTNDRWMKDELIAAARSGIGKIDALGVRGVTLCSMREIEAMAIVAATSSLLDETIEHQDEERKDK